ncbi:phospholipid methyltransferase [Nannizzia gypsea CBS 118893]|uniref:Phospholipid methyltransferase n=1 Tax=Arthroderma gypseum (strain ATCC MYA-4604 / CBS 118893) TaxID=535722 RepID=E4USY9_ARTGP|nr:phospholipid methyltransferase [Nannizzia gypsea CBS 118893]EFR00602.1 phospholipid methyltransferase [Nannizzia gypsea CBS 118893]
MPTVGERIYELAEPGFLGVWAAYSFMTVMLETILRGQLLAPIFKLQEIKEEAFSRFWISFSGARDKANQDPNAPVPEPAASSALIPPLLAHADGVVLDIGPGTGTQTPLFTSPNLRIMYGAEPCLGLHEDLSAKVESCGLGSKYRILHCGAQPDSLLPALKKAGALDDENNEGKGVFDTIVCVRVLCSVPEPEKTIKGLYDLLKPGGKILICEHVVNPWTTPKGSSVARFVQALYGLSGWSFFMGGCNLDRDTERTLRAVGDADGGWGSVDLESSFTSGPLPYVSGTLVKRG